MKIIYLRLKNYRRIKEAEIEFPEGVIGIIGPNGSGKTTLVESIAWVLFGNKRDITRGLGPEELVWRGADKGESVWGELCFKMGGSEYVLERNLKTATLKTSDGRVLAKGIKGVEKKVQEILGVDYKGFFHSVFSRQNELRVFSSLRPEERKKLIERLVGFSAVEAARKKASEDLRFSEKKIEMLERDLFRDGVDQFREAEKEKAEKEERVARLSEKKDALEKERERLSEAIAEAEKERDEVEKKMRLFSVKKKELEGLRETITDRRLEIEDVEKKLADIEKKEKMMADFRGIKEVVERLRKKNEDFVRLRHEIEKKREVENDIERLDLEIDKIQKELSRMGDLDEKQEALEDEKAVVVREREKKIAEKERASEAAVRASSRVERLKKEIDEVVEHLESIKGLGRKGKCPTCERPLGEHYEELLRKYEKKMEELRKEEERLSLEEEKSRSIIEALDMELKSLDERLRDIEKREKALAKRFERKRSLQEQIEEKKRRREELLARLAEIGDVVYDAEAHKRLEKVELPEAEKKLQMYHKLTGEVSVKGSLIERRERLLREVEEAEKKAEALEKELVSMGDVEEEYEKVVSRLENLRSEERSLSENLNGVVAEMVELRSALRWIEKRILDLREKKEELVRLREEVNVLSVLVGKSGRGPSLLRDFRDHLFGRVKRAIAVVASEIFSEITSRYSGIDFDVEPEDGAGGEGGDRFEVYINDGGVFYPISRFSGGEVDAANLSIRIAISRVVAEMHGESTGAPIRLLVLDEVFGSQDETRRRGILEKLQRMVSGDVGAGWFSQIFVISHIEDIKEGVDHIIRLVEQDDGSSVVVMD